MAEQLRDEAAEVLPARLRFVRRLRAMLDAELDAEEHALLSLLRECGCRGGAWAKRNTASR